MHVSLNRCVCLRSELMCPEIVQSSHTPFILAPFLVSINQSINQSINLKLPINQSETPYLACAALWPYLTSPNRRIAQQIITCRSNKSSPEPQTKESNHHLKQIITCRSWERPIPSLIFFIVVVHTILNLQFWQIPLLIAGLSVLGGLYEAHEGRRRQTVKVWHQEVKRSEDEPHTVVGKALLGKAIMLRVQKETLFAASALEQVKTVDRHAPLSLFSALCGRPLNQSIHCHWLATRCPIINTPHHTTSLLRILPYKSLAHQILTISCRRAVPR